MAEEIIIELPDNIDDYDEDTQNLIIEYLEQLTPIQIKAYTIAKEHLGSSFNLVKSNGYVDWLKTKTT
jgi:hypothetical protein